MWLRSAEMVNEEAVVYFAVVTRHSAGSTEENHGGHQNCRSGPQIRLLFPELNERLYQTRIGRPDLNRFSLKKSSSHQLLSALEIRNLRNQHEIR
jgi:hypothetical protein